MSADTPPEPAAERLAGLPDEVTMQEIADARGVSKSAVQVWVKSPTWPASVGKRGRSILYPNGGVATWLKDNEAEGRADVAKLGDDPDELVTLLVIAERTGLPAGTVSAYPTLYGLASADPFPGGDSLGRRRVGDVAPWLSRRSSRGGIRATTAAPAKGAGQAAAAPAFSEDEIDIKGIEAATGLSREAAKSLLRRPEIAAMSTGKVGRSRVWPRKELLAELKKLGYNVPEDKPAKLTAAERQWRAGGPRSASELAAHYGVTIGAISHRIKRARDADGTRGRAPEPVDPAADHKRYDPVEFDAFWTG